MAVSSPLSAEEIEKFSLEQKLALFDVLAESLQPAILQDFWPMEELQERMRLVDEGKMKTYPLDEVMDRLKAKLREKRVVSK